MRTKPKVVVDTNVFIDGLLDEKISSEQIMDLFNDNKITLLFSQDTVGEFVYMLEKIARRSIRDIEKRMKFLNNIIYIYYHSRSVNTVNVDYQLNVKCNDPNDDMFLDCAFHGKADYLVTDDIASGMHGLNIGETLILTSEDFIESYKKEYSH